MSWTVGLGVVLVALVLRELFHTVFHPAGRGSISMAVFRSVWRASGALGGQARALAGPTAMVLVILIWSLGLIAGWALIYWPWMPTDYVYASGLSKPEQDGFFDAVYFSWVTQATLGFGDIVPRSQPLRLLAPLQATIGFALLTVAVSWVLSVYPALQRQRAAASRVQAVSASHREVEELFQSLPDPAVARQLSDLADAVTSCRVDLVQFPSTFYFAAPSPDTSLAAASAALAELAYADYPGEESRLAARELAAALRGLATVLDDQMGSGSATPAMTFAAFRRHHGEAS